MNSRWQRAWANPVVRGLLLFSAFRAVYGMGILVVIYMLATNQATPWWTSLVFLGCSMVFSRWLFRRLKQRWPTLFAPSKGSDFTELDEVQTTP